jgi:flagellar biosynthesis protein
MSEPGKSPLAVALSYEAPRAPKVVAMGRGWLGQKIIDTAREHGVPLREDPALAEALSTLELDTEIPEALYAVVAKVIAFVLRTGGGAGVRPSTRALTSAALDDAES